MLASSGYITDTPYVPGFYANMAPIAMRHVAVLNRNVPPGRAGAFRYLELGCGLGRVFTTLAAANPEAEFVGVDINPVHTAFADWDIRVGQLANARVLTLDFASLPEDLGRFDFIAVHGVLSWVSAEVREQLLAICRAHLAPGGVLLVSYNAMPGWSHLQPIRGILRQYASLRQGDAQQKARDAMAYLVLLRERQAKYFLDNPAAAAYVDSLLHQDVNYVAHEYLHDHWSTYYFSDVVEFFARAGVGYVGSLPAFQNFWEFCVRPEFHDLFRTSVSRLVSEAHKDICANTAFRWDLYGLSCGLIGSVADRLACADDILYRVARAGITFPCQVNLGQVVSTVQGEPFESLTAVLSRSALRLSELMAAPELSACDPDVLVTSLDAGVAMGLFEILAQPMQELPAELPDQPHVAHPFNAHLLATEAFGDRPIALASRVSGSGYPVTGLDAAILHELTTAGSEVLEQRVLDGFRATGKTMNHNGQPVTDPNQMKSLIDQACRQVREVLVPQLMRLGVLVAP